MKTGVDTIQRLFDLQKVLMVFLGVEDDQTGHQHFSENTKAAVIGMVSESVEVLDEMSNATKPWKQKPFDIHMKSVREEMADVMFYFIEAMILLNIDWADFVKAFERKQTIVLARTITNLTNDANMRTLVQHSLTTKQQLSLDNVAWVGIRQMMNLLPMVCDHPSAFLDDPVKFVAEHFDKHGVSIYGQKLVD